MKTDSYLGFYLLQIGVIILAFSQVYLSSGSFLSELFIDAAPEMFWTYTILALILFSILTIIVIFWKPNHNIFQDETRADKERTRRVGEDLLFAIFILGFLFYGIPMNIFGETYYIVEYFSNYLFFFIVSLIYFFLSKMQHYMSTKEKKFFHFGNAQDYLYIILNTVFWFLIVLIVAQVLPAIFYSDGQDLLLFMTFASIPAEEFVFRGMGIIIIGAVVEEIYNDVKKIPKKDQKKSLRGYKIGQFVGVVITSFLFGIYHIHVYGFDLATIIYLMFLGFVCAWATIKRSIMSAYLIHLLNNFGANNSASMATDFFTNPYYLLIIGLIAIGIISFFVKLKSDSKK